MRDYPDDTTKEMCESADEMFDVALKIKGPAYVVAAMAVLSMQQLAEMVIHTAACTDKACKLRSAVMAVELSKGTVSSMAGMFSEADREELFNFVTALTAKGEEIGEHVLAVRKQEGGES